MKEQNSTEQPEEEPQAAEKTSSAPLWRAPSVRVLPGYVALLALLATGALGWLAAEFFWPNPQPAGLEVTRGKGDDDAGAPPEAASEEVTFSETVFSMRTKLFVPEVPVESKETSWTVIEEMFAQLKLTTIFVDPDDEERYALVQLAERAPGRSDRRGYRSSRTASSRTVKVKKGDRLLDFTVEEVKENGVELSLARFKKTLHF